MSGPSGFEQLSLELVNRFRLDPGGEFHALIRDADAREARDGDVSDALRWFAVDMSRLRAALDALDPAAPLAWSEALAQAARGHSALMKSEGVQSHRVGRDANNDGILQESEFLEPDLGGRVRAAGYDLLRVGENVFAYARSAIHGHAGMVIDWGYGPHGMQEPAGHRMNLVDAAFTEIGIGAVRASGAVGPWVMTQVTGTRFDDAPRLVGVVYRDRDGDGFYSIGEGEGGVSVAVGGSGQVRSWASGGYQIAAEGPVTATFGGGSLPRPVKVAAEMASENGKIDLVDGRFVESSVSVRELAGARGLRLLGAEDIDASGASGRDEVIGNSGDNALAGGRGRDRLEGGGGADRLSGDGGPDRLFGQAGDDALLGRAGADRLKGDAGADVLEGGGGGDLLRGGGGDDRLHGGGGGDRLKGGAGADLLDGGAGRDVLVGGGGADLFRFGGKDGVDRILDFREGDRIDLRGAGLDFDDLTLRERGAHAVIAFGDAKVIVLDAADDLGRDDFLF